MQQSPELQVELARGVISTRVDQQVQALVYSLNRELQRAYIKRNLSYVDLLLSGGRSEFLGRPIDVMGLDRAGRLLSGLPPDPRVDQLREFVGDARLALAQTGNALRATANPIELERTGQRGRTWALSADVQAYALALTISFLALMLAAGSLAAERDENVVGRLARGLVTLGQLVWAKVALAGATALVLGLAVALAFGAFIELGNVEGGEPWFRLPLLALGLVFAGGALGAVGALLGALAREARAASLVALAVVLPIVFLGLVPREVVPVAGWISDALPFIHAVRFFSAALYDLSPWETLAREAAWLAAIGAIFGGLARIGTRRLLA
jgi:ABC-2 type transport system permease protein